MNLRKKVSALTLICVLLLLAGCGNGGDSSSASAEAEQGSASAETVKTLNLEGSWIAETQGSGYYLAGFIKDDLVELHWVSSTDQNGSVYWAGTYTAPKDDPATYEWESKRDAAIMNTSNYASVDDSRTFTYADGKLTLTASSTGAQTVLVPSEKDYTYLAVEVSDEERAAANAADTTATEQGSAEDEEVVDIAVKDSAYTVQSIGAGKSVVYYAVELENKNKYNAILTPNIEITVRDSSGRLLTKQHYSLAAVAPGETVTYGDVIKVPKGTPAEVEITAQNYDYDFVAYAGSGIHSVKDLKVGKVTEDTTGAKPSFSGSITNESDSEMQGVVASVIFSKEGKIVGGISCRVGTIAAGTSADFTITSENGFSDYDSYKVYATQEPV